MKPIAAHLSVWTPQQIAEGFRAAFRDALQSAYSGNVEMWFEQILSEAAVVEDERAFHRLCVVHDRVVELAYQADGPGLRGMPLLSALRSYRPNPTATTTATASPPAEIMPRAELSALLERRDTSPFAKWPEKVAALPDDKYRTFAKTVIAYSQPGGSHNFGGACNSAFQRITKA